MADLVEITITTPLPEEAAIDTTYKIEGSARMFDDIGAPPFVYAEVKKKEWFKPEVIEETTYLRGFPMPVSGDFTIEWRPEKTGIYEVTLVATPAPLSLPAVGVPPITGKSDTMKVTIAKEIEAEVAGLKISSYEKVTA